MVRRMNFMGVPAIEPTGRGFPHTTIAPDENTLRLAHPIALDENTLRLAHPSAPDENALRLAHPIAPDENTVRCSKRWGGGFGRGTAGP